MLAPSDPLPAEAAGGITAASNPWHPGQLQETPFGFSLFNFSLSFLLFFLPSSPFFSSFFFFFIFSFIFFDLLKLEYVEAAGVSSRTPAPLSISSSALQDLGGHPGIAKKAP